MNRRSLRHFALAVAAGLLLVAQPAVLSASTVQSDILSQVSDLRGLQPKTDVPLEVVDTAKVQQDMLEAVNGDEASRELEISRRVLIMLGLVAPDVDLRTQLAAAYGENILGYYNHKDKKMYVVSGREEMGPSERITLAHEFTHALQDQYFDLGTLNEAAKNQSDKSLAVTSLIEGDATVSMALYADRYLTIQDRVRLASESGGGASSIDRLPQILREEMLFPYQQGAAFVAKLWRAGGFEAVNRAFANPPSSTEQIIHPEKYLAGEGPMEVNLPDLAAAAGPGWTQLRADVLGEIDARLILEPFTGGADAARASEGWGGDRYAVLRHADGRHILVMDWLWDTPRDAEEFAGSYLASVANRYKTPPGPLGADGKVRLNTPDGPQLVWRRGNEVIAVLAPDEPTLAAVAGAFNR